MKVEKRSIGNGMKMPPLCPRCGGVLVGIVGTCTMECLRCKRRYDMTEVV